MANSLSGLVGLTVGLPCSQVGTLESKQMLPQDGLTWRKSCASSSPRWQTTLGCEAALARTERIVAEGSSADRQEDVYRQAMLDGADIGEALRAVVDSVIAETEDEGAPPMAPVEAPDTGTRGFVSR